MDGGASYHSDKAKDEKLRKPWEVFGVSIMARVFNISYKRGVEHNFHLNSRF